MGMIMVITPYIVLPLLIIVFEPVSYSAIWFDSDACFEEGIRLA